jgi:hypothetical protein
MPGNPLTDPDWAPKLADTIVRIVGGIRDKTTAKVLTACRAIIFGLIAAFGGAVAIVLLIIAMFRGVQALLDIGLDHHNSVWVSYLALGALFTVAGLIAMRKRFPADDAPGEPA